MTRVPLLLAVLLSVYTTTRHPTQDQMTQDPTAQDPTAQDPTAQDPTAQDPTAQDPTAQDPTAQDPTTKGPSSDLDALQGVWRYVSRSFADEVLPVGDADQVVVTGNKLTKTRSGDTVRSTLTLGADQSFTETVTESDGTVTVGIGRYRLAGGLAVFQFSIQGHGSPPKELRLSPGQLHGFTVLQR